MRSPSLFIRKAAASLVLLLVVFGVLSVGAVGFGADTAGAAGIFDLGGNTSDQQLSDGQSSPWSFLPGIATDGDTLGNVDSLLGRAATVARTLMGVIAMIMGMIAVYRMVMSRGQEDQYEKGVQTLVWAVAGIGLIAISTDLANIVSPYQGGLLGSDVQIRARAMLFDDTVRIVVTFLKYIAGAVAVAMLVRVGFRMVTVGQADDELTQDKRNIGLIALGLLVLIFGDGLVRNIFYKIDSPLADKPAIDLPGAMQELISFTNIIVTLVGPIAVATLVAGGLMFVLSGVNEEYRERGRKMVVVSLVGIILLYSAFGIVNTIILGQFA